MKSKKSTFNLLVDFVLFIGFLVLFFLDFTGLNLHQWLGVAMGGVVLYHLVGHWKWVVAVVNSVKQAAGKKVGLFFALDTAILFGLTLILVSGLAISSWFNLPLTNPGAWVDLHISLSIMTLVLIVVKIGLHWQWIVKNIGRGFSSARPLAARPLPVSTQIDRQRISRRQFLTLMGVVSLAAYLSIRNVLRVEDPLVAKASYTGTEAGQGAAQDPGTAAGSLPSTGSNSATGIVVGEIQPTNTELPANEQFSSSTESQATRSAGPSGADSLSQQSSSGLSETCSVRCNRGCSYPGHCRRYVDTNSNGKCDLGECV